MAAATTTKRRKRRGKGNLLAGFDASVEEQSALDQYLRDVSRHELITPEREKELGSVRWGTRGQLEAEFVAGGDQARL